MNKKHNYLSKQPTKGKSTEDISRERRVEIQLRMAAERSFTENATDPMMHLKIVTFANPGESWNSRTVISGCDQQISPGTFQSPWPLVRNRSRTIVQEHPKNGRPSSGRPRSRRSRKTMMDEVMPTGKHHLGDGANLLTWTSSIMATLEFERNA